MIKQQNAKGILLMIVSMGAFAAADTLVKISASIISPAQVMFFLLGGGLIVFGLMAKLQGEQLRLSEAFTPILLLRYLAEVSGMVGMVMALASVPISTVGAITQATPLLVAAGAVLFLGEKVSWRRWSSIAVGFAGVLLIVRPGAAGFEVTVLWAILATVSLSVRDLTTRLTPPGMASTSLATYTMLASLPFPLGWVLYRGEALFPAEANWIMVIAMIGLGSLGYMLLILSIRMAEVSKVTPFRYTRLLFLLVIGIVVFKESPTATTLLGATLIIASGIYMMWREQRVKRLQAQKQ